MAATIGSRAETPAMSFALVAGTSRQFSFPAGVMQINLQASDPNNPGTTTLTDASFGAVLATCSTSIAPIPGFGTIWQQVAAQGQSFVLSCTADQQEVSIYFDDNPPV
jgi:hypothetical protein